MAKATAVSTCAHCGQDFIHLASVVRIYCSVSCSAKARATPERMRAMQVAQARSRAALRITTNCARCGEPFEHLARISRKFCSPRCNTLTQATP